MGKTKLDETYMFKISVICDSFDVGIGIKIPFFRVLVTIEPGRSLLQFVTTNCLIFSMLGMYDWKINCCRFKNVQDLYQQNKQGFFSWKFSRSNIKTKTKINYSAKEGILSLTLYASHSNGTGLVFQESFLRN